MVIRYKSKVDVSLFIALTSTIAVCVAVVFPLLVSGGITHWLMSLSILAIGAGLPASILIATWYDVDDTRILIRSGFFTWEIPLAGIKTITPSRSLISGPALSFDRLRIDYNKWNSVLVSPKDKAAFIQQVEKNIAAAKDKTPKPI